METTTLPELRKLSNEFRDVVSRAIRSTSHDARKNLLRLLAFVRNSPTLARQVTAAPSPADDPMEELRRAQNTRSKLDLPIDPHEELGFLHSLLTALAEDEAKDFWHLTFYYDGKSSIKESVQAVLSDVIVPYSTILNREIEHRMIDHPDADRRPDGIAFHISGGTAQVNVARDNARIVARQEVSAEIQGVVEAVTSLLHELQSTHGAEIPHDVAEDLRELGEMALEEVNKPKPRKLTLRMLHERFLATASTVEGVQILSGLTMAVAERLGQLL